jgi:hypothetical protein
MFFCLSVTNIGKTCNNQIVFPQQLSKTYRNGQRKERGYLSVPPRENE